MTHAAPAPTAPLLGATGYYTRCWASRVTVDTIAAAAAKSADASDGVLVNPHLTETWAQFAVGEAGALDHVAELLGPDIAVENSFLITKRPGLPFAVPPHQDGVNDAIELDPARAVSVWLALTAAPNTAGCLEVVPGSHRHGYLPYTREPGPGPRRALTIAPGALPPPAAFTPVPVSAGEAVIFDVRLIHRSGPNTTNRPRLGLNIRYVAPDAFRRGHPAERPGWLPITGTW